MSEEAQATIRALPGGEYREAVAGGWDGRILQVTFPDPGTREYFAVGAPIEVDTGTQVYLGVFEELGSSGGSILVEHLVEKSNIEWIERVWN